MSATRKDRKALLSIDTGYACAGIVIDETGRCLEAAPIFSWMIGKNIKKIKHWRKIKSIEIATLLG